jgi:hypothetical protein
MFGSGHELLMSNVQLSTGLKAPIPNWTCSIACKYGLTKPPTSELTLGDRELLVYSELTPCWG